MTTSYYETLGRGVDAPISGEGLKTMIDPRMSEEVDQTENVNNQIDSLVEDKNRYYEMLIQQYNHMYKKPTPVEQLVSTLKGGVEFKQQLNKYEEQIRPIRAFSNRMKEAKLIHQTGSGEGYGWYSKLSPERQQQILKGNIEAADDDIDKDNKGDKELLATQVEVNKHGYHESDSDLKHELTTIGAIKDENGVGNVEKDRLAYKDYATVVQDFDGFFAKAQYDMWVRLPDGRVTNFADARNQQEARAVMDVLVYHYLNANGEIARGRNGRFKKHVWSPIIKAGHTLTKSKFEQLAKIQGEVGAQARAEDLKYRIQTDPGYFKDHVNLHVEKYGSYKAAKLHAATTIARYAKTGVLDRATVEKVLDHEFESNLSTPEKPHVVTARDYWKQESSIMLAGVTAFEKEQVENATNEEKYKLEADALKTVTDMQSSKTPITVQSRWEAIVDFANKHGISIEAVPDILKKLATATDVADAELVRELEQRQLRGDSITLEDIQGIEDHQLKLQWMKQINKGTDSKERNKFITAAVNQKTQETDLEQAKTIKYRAYEANATAAFNDAYNEARETGTHEQAMAAGRKAVLDGLQLGKPGDTSWSKYGGTVQPASEKIRIGKAKVNLGKDPNLINSIEPWEGEEQAIKSAIAYTNGETNSIPTYYQSLVPMIKRLPNGDAGTARRIMRWRLLKLGIIKESDFNKPKLRIYEDKLPQEVQQLLRKPSPAKTLRVINDEDTHKIRLIDPTQFSSYDKGGDIEVEAKEELRSKAQTSQQYALVDSSYRTLVNIPEELNNEFVAQVGELPPYLQLNNLAPDVAKAFIGDVLMT